MSFCILPWIHLEVRPHGTVHPCCLHVTGTTENNLQEISIEEFWQSEYMINLRQEFLDGKKPKGCIKCWNTESANAKSKRLVDNEKFAEHFYKKDTNLENPVYLDLKLGTVCNIKCRTCSTYSSSKWAEDEKLIYGNPLNISSNKWVEQDSDFWTELESMLDNIEYIDFTGGEPFLVKQHIRILRRCVEQDIAKNISIHYNTNGTIKPSEELFELWKNFKWVEVMFSIDGLEDKFEYLRHPAKWSTVLENFNLIKQQAYIHTSICHTISLLNVYYLPEFIKWFRQQDLLNDRLYLNILHHPNYFCVKNLPSNLKKKIIKKLKKIKDYDVKFVIEFINQHGTYYDKELFENINLVDSIRKENFSKTFSEFYGIIK